MGNKIEDISSVQTKRTPFLHEYSSTEKCPTLECILEKYKRDIQTKGIDVILSDLAAFESRLRLVDRQLVHSQEKIELDALDQAIEKKISTYNRMINIILPALECTLGVASVGLSFIYGSKAGHVAKVLAKAAEASNTKFTTQNESERVAYDHIHTTRTKIQEICRQDINENKQSFQRMQELTKRAEETHGRLWDLLTSNN